jgi:hypothetical protein
LSGGSAGESLIGERLGETRWPPDAGRASQRDRMAPFGARVPEDLAGLCGHLSRGLAVVDAEDDRHPASVGMRLFHALWRGRHARAVGEAAGDLSSRGRAFSSPRRTPSAYARVRQPVPHGSEAESQRPSAALTVSGPSHKPSPQQCRVRRPSQGTTRRSLVPCIARPWKLSSSCVVPREVAADAT